MPPPHPPSEMTPCAPTTRPFMTPKRRPSPTPSPESTAWSGCWARGPSARSGSPSRCASRDARALATVRHPHILKVHDLRSAEGGSPYLVMEYVEGGSLEGRLTKDGPLPWQAAAHYVADVGEALLEAHASGVIHRDIKPANI